jgi:glycosyltransferase involved in cell wall biosynthesis
VPGVRVALLTTYLAPYRLPLYERLAERYGVEVLCFGRGERYVPPWFADLDRQLARTRFPARRVSGVRGALAAARGHQAVIGPFAGGAVLPAAYAGARGRRRRFVLWASVWAQPRSRGHLAALPAIRHIYRHADAVVTYGPHVSGFVASIRGHDQGVFVAPQAVEPELFARTVDEAETEAFRRRFGLDNGPIALYVGRLVPEKGVDVLLAAWRAVRAPGTLVLIGDGPLAAAARAAAGSRAAGTSGTVRLLGALPREQLPVAYANAAFTVLPSVPTPRFQEPWGLVCNEAMHQARPVIASDTAGAVAGGLVRHGETGLVVPSGDPRALARTIELLLTDAALRDRLGSAALGAVAPYTYDAAADAFGQALGAY